MTWLGFVRGGSVVSCRVASRESLFFIFDMILFLFFCGVFFLLFAATRSGLPKFASTPTSLSPPKRGFSWKEPGSGSGPGRGRPRGSANGGGAQREAPLSPRRPLVGIGKGKDDAAGGAATVVEEGEDEESEAGEEEEEEAPQQPKRRFFFGTETMRSLASSLSPPPTAAAAGASKLPSEQPLGSPPSATHASSSAPALPPTAPLGAVKRATSSGGKGWAETMSGGKGELPSLLAPVELHARDGEGVTHQVRREEGGGGGARENGTRGGEERGLRFLCCILGMVCPRQWDGFV